MDDLGDGAERRIVQTRLGQQHLEGAALAAVGELALEHVEAQVARLGGIARARHELEARVGVDKAADKPGRGDAIDLDALARHPSSIPQRFGHGFRFGRGHDVLLLSQTGLEAGHQPFGRFAPVGAEEINGDDLVEVAAQPRHLDRELGAWGARSG